LSKKEKTPTLVSAFSERKFSIRKTSTRFGGWLV